MKRTHAILAILVLASEIAACLSEAAVPQNNESSQSIVNQGAIYLDNYESNRPIFYGTIGNPAAGMNFYVQVLGGPDAQSLQPVTSIVHPFSSIFNLGAGDVGSGFFDGGIGVVPGVRAYEVATFQVLAWTGAASYDASSQRISSDVFTMKTGEFMAGGPLPDPAIFTDFPADLVISAIPEPSTLALGLMGALTCWLIIRTKRV